MNSAIETRNAQQMDRIHRLLGAQKITVETETAIAVTRLILGRRHKDQSRPNNRNEMTLVSSLRLTGIRIR
jgi:hypothetical protein